VTYNNGQLTIFAENCTIGDVMRAVRTQTGAVIDLPPNATERVASRVGPGAPRDVLASLLNGSDFNYVLLGSAADPKAVQHIILTPKPMGGPTNAMAGGQPFSPAQNMANAQQPQVANDNEEADSETEAAEESQEDQADGQAQGLSNGQANPQPGVKTPEQLLQELQRQQQQLIQQQQQQPGTAQPGGAVQPNQPNQVPQTPPQE
jgi:hypothetical protein